MNTTYNQTHAVYASHQRADETVRETESHALLSCASKLEQARSDNSTMDDYITAIKQNQKLWTIFQVALCEPDNALPRDLKLLLLNISRYIDKVSFRALTEYNTDLLRSLIDLNRTIAAGLAVKSADATKPAPDAPAVQPQQPPADYAGVSITTMA